MGFIKEFKDFASKGSLLDVAVAFVMGLAFGRVISAFTGGIVAPFITLFTGGADFSEKELVLKPSTEVMDAEGAVVSGYPAVALEWGNLLTATIDFLIVAMVMFLMIKAVNSRKKKEAAAPPAGPSSTDQLLMEIRDELKK